MLADGEVPGILRADSGENSQQLLGQTLEESGVLPG